MLSLTYLSSAAQLLSATELADLLVAWRPRNHERQITGLLLYSGGNIIQTLEGPTEEVTRTFAEIALDPRHTGVIEVLRDPIDERAFPDWSMGFNDISDVDTADLEGFNDYLQLPQDHAGPGQRHVQTMLEVFKRYKPVTRTPRRAMRPPRPLRRAVEPHRTARADLGVVRVIMAEFGQPGLSTLLAAAPANS